jgi:hypothetical protein
VEEKKKLSFLCTVEKGRPTSSIGTAVGAKYRLCPSIVRFEYHAERLPNSLLGLQRINRVFLCAFPYYIHNVLVRFVIVFIIYSSATILYLLRAVHVCYCSN